MRLPILTTAAALTLAVALPGAAQAATPTAQLPCVEVLLVSISCPQSPAPRAGQACPGRHLAPSAATLARVRTATHCLINQQRTKRGLKKLKSVTTLQRVATAYAKRMAREDFFEHTSPDGGTFLSRIKRTSYLRGGLSRWSVGENIAWATGELATPERIVRAWMASPGHKRNILNSRFTELGLGVAVGAPEAGADAADAATYVNEFGERRR
ncbi:MAG: hypothetical protein JWO90_1727 [Solirubrobacterales bacterium]|jgi:uncharacterized protein YkwD|nr:hypothetical protein [Solirubrobacterales bacterium]